MLNRGARGALRGLTFTNVTVRVGVYGNATRAGVHDLRPVNVGPETIAANVSGWFFEAADARVRGGAVAFVPPAQPTWARGVCNATTTRLASILRASRARRRSEATRRDGIPRDGNYRRRFGSQREGGGGGLK